MNQRTAIVAALGLALAAAAGYGVYSLGMSRGMQGTPAAAATATSAPAKDAAGRKVLYWHDPMVPGQKFDKPGKSPYMDMDLVPVYAEEGADAGGVSISPRVQQNLGIRVAEATRGEIGTTVEAVGTVAYNERDVAMVQARANGFLEKLYVPDWVAAQEEYLGIVRMGTAGMDDLREGALQRMRLAGMSDEVIKRVVAGGKVMPRITIVAPIGGVIGELAAREGMTVMSGAPLFRINGLSTIWVNAEVPEAQSALVRPGNAVEAHAAAFPGKTFKGRVSAILPEVAAQTRTIKARVELANPSHELVPGMFATVNFTAAAKRQAVLVPTEAVIPTGKRTVVVVAETADDGKTRYRPVDVETGAESQGRTEIRKGLEAGAKVVVSGQFLIDSEASLKATLGRMGDAPSALGEGRGEGADAHHASGKIESIDAHSALISHGPVPSLKWGPMTMEFAVRHGVGIEGVKPGDTIAFDFVQTPKGEFEITGLTPSPTLPQGGGRKP